MSDAVLYPEADPVLFAERLKATGLGVHRAVDELLDMVDREKRFNKTFPKGRWLFRGAGEQVEKIRHALYADKLAAIELGARLGTARPS